MNKIMGKTRIELFKFDAASGVTEFHAIIHVTDQTLSYHEQVEALLMDFGSLLQGEAKGAVPVIKRYFLSDAANQADYLMAQEMETIRS